MIPAHLRSVLLVVIAIFTVNVSCVSVTSSSFFNSANSHDIASKLIVGRDRINVLTKPGNYHLSSIFFLSALFWEFLMLGIFINNNSFLESNSKFIFKDTDFTHNPPFVFRTNYLQTNFSNVFNNSYSFESHNIFENFVNFFSCRFYYLNLIFNVKYFIESLQFSELPSVFNSVTSIEFPTNHVLYFMDFTQLNSSKDAPYFYILICYFVFTPLLFTFLLSECKSNNTKKIISLKRSKYQLRTKKSFFKNKTKSHHISFTTCFIIRKFILV